MEEESLFLLLVIGDEGVSIINYTKQKGDFPKSETCLGASGKNTESFLTKLCKCYCVPYPVCAWANEHY